MTARSRTPWTRWAGWPAAEGIDCHYAKGGTIVAGPYRRPSCAGPGPPATRALRRRRPRPPAICGRVRTTCSAASYRPDCAAIHPARLVRGLAAAVERRGVTVHEGTPRRGIAPGRVTTDHGVVRAGVVVRALEGYTATLPGHRRALVPVYSLMIATEPLPAATGSGSGWPGGRRSRDQRHLIIYGQRTADDRLAFGGRGAPYHFGSRIEPGYDRVPAVFDALRRTLTEMFGIDPPIAYRWGGPLGDARGTGRRRSG